MKYRIALLKGDGIGPEIIDEAVKCLDVVAKKFGHEFEYDTQIIGGEAIDAVGVPLPQKTVDACLASDAVLMGAVGGPRWDTIDPSIRPEVGLLGIRKALGTFVNIRPAKLYAPLADACPLKPERLGSGLDLIVCRELTGDVYFGRKWRDDDAIRTVTEKYIDELKIKCTGSKQNARELSGGNQQKICLAKAFALEPRVLFVSEPTRGIDVGAKALVLDALKKFNRENGVTVVMVSSELEELRSTCDRIAIVSGGRISGILPASSSVEDFGELMLNNVI